MKITKIATMIDNISVKELNELCELGFIDSFTVEEEVFTKNGFLKGYKDTRELDPEAHDTEGLDWYAQLTKKEQKKLKEVYSNLMGRK